MNNEDGALHGDREVRKMSTSENYLRDGRDLWRMSWLPSRVSGWTEKSESWEVEREDNGFSFQRVGFAVSVGWPNGRGS